MFRGDGFLLRSAALRIGSLRGPTPHTHFSMGIQQGSVRECLSAFTILKMTHAFRDALSVERNLISTRRTNPFAFVLSANAGLGTSLRSLLTRGRNEGSTWSTALTPQLCNEGCRCSLLVFCCLMGAR